MPIWIGVLIALIYGLVVGSFLNVCIWRMPNDMSIVKPGSHCPKCKTQLKSRDLIPLFSFLIQGRKCRYCGEPISWRYFGIELLTGVFFVITYLRFAMDGDTRGILDFVTYALFGSALIAIFFIDLEHYIIPDQLNLFGIGLGLARDGFGIATGLWDWKAEVFGRSIPLPASVFGMLVCGLFFMAIAFVSYYIFRKEAMGGGDIKLAAAVGALLGASFGMASFLLAFFIGTFISLALMGLKLKGRKDMVPFGPFMVVGAFVAMFFQPQIVQAWTWYLRISGLIET